MSDIYEKLNILKSNLDLIKKRIDSTKLENQLLKSQQSQLVTEKSELIKKNEDAKNKPFENAKKTETKNKLKAILERINNIGTHG